MKTIILPHSVLSTCTVTKLTDKKVMRSEEITLRYQNKDQLLILKHIYAYKANTVSNQPRLQLSNLAVLLINEQHAAATFQVKVLSVSVLVTC